jgi:hypothetical protein
MQSIKLKSHIGADGILKLEEPVEERDTDMEITLLLTPVGQPLSSEGSIDLSWPPGFFEKTYGCMKDEPLTRMPDG